VSKPNAILIAGSTASGKSALALKLAETIGGTVINADSMQVYRDLRIITARPTPAERRVCAAPPLRPCRRGGELFGLPLVRRRKRGDCQGGAGRTPPAHIRFRQRVVEMSPLWASDRTKVKPDTTRKHKLTRG
jgi:hypothetical protein